MVLSFVGVGVRNKEVKRRKLARHPVPRGNSPISADIKDTSSVIPAIVEHTLRQRPSRSV